MSAEMTVFVPHIMMERIIKTIFLFTRCLFSLLVLFITLIATRFPIVLPLTIFFLLIVVVIAAVRKLILISTVVVIFLVPILIIIIIFSFILKPVVISESSI